MNIDDLLMTIIVGGMALSVVYLRAEFIGHRRYKSADKQEETCLRKLFERPALSLSQRVEPIIIANLQILCCTLRDGCRRST